MADQIVINGEAYDIPESFTLKELRVIDRYTGGHTGEDGYSSSKLSGVIHVAIMRAKPSLPFDEIQAVVDELDADVLTAIPDGQSPPAVKTSGEDASSNEDSGAPSGVSPENGSPSPIGSPDLAAGFRLFHGTSTTSPRAS